MSQVHQSQNCVATHFAPRSSPHELSAAFNRSVRLLFPAMRQALSEGDSYLGRFAALRRLFPRVPMETIRSWGKHKKKRPPRYAREVLAARLDRLAQEARELSQELLRE